MKKGMKIFLLIFIIVLALAIAFFCYMNAKRTEDYNKKIKQITEKKAEEMKKEEEKRIASHVYSHRGAMKEEIEHTFKSYDLAISYGSQNIEQDLVLSADGTLYVSHDLSAKRITGTNKKYINMSDEEIDKLRTLDGQKILRLTEVFDKYKKSVNYIIEIKDKNSQTIEQFEKVIDEYGLHENVVVQCSDLGALEELEKWDSKMPKLLLCKTSINFNNGIKSDCVDILSVEKHMMNKIKCNITHENKKQFNVWTLNKESEIKKAIDLGVDTYFTNDTKLALSLEKKYRK